MPLSVSLGSPAFLSPAILGYNRVARNFEESTGRLAGGKRILESGDDSASLSISLRLKAQVSELKQSAKNVAYGDSLVDVAKSGLTRIQDKLDEAATIASQANTTTISETERNLLQIQLQDTLSSIDTVVSDTTFNGRNLLDGTFSDVDIRVGPEEDDIVNLAITDVRTSSLFSGGLPSIATQGEAATAETTIDAAIATVGNLVGDLEGIQGRFGAASGNLETNIGGVNQADSALSDTNIETETLANTAQAIQLDIGSAVIAQTQQLSSDLLTVLDFKIGENTRQNKPYQAEDEGTASVQPNTEHYVSRIKQAFAA